MQKRRKFFDPSQLPVPGEKESPPVTDLRIGQFVVPLPARFVMIDENGNAVGARGEPLVCLLVPDEPMGDVVIMWQQGHNMTPKQRETVEKIRQQHWRPWL